MLNFSGTIIFNEDNICKELIINFYSFCNNAKMSSTNPLRGIMDANRLIGPNFTDWLMNLKILLKSKRIAYVLEGDGPVEPISDASEDEVWEY